MVLKEPIALFLIVSIAQTTNYFSDKLAYITHNYIKQPELQKELAASTRMVG